MSWCPHCQAPVGSGLQFCPTCGSKVQEAPPAGSYGAAPGGYGPTPYGPAPYGPAPYGPAPYGPGPGGYGPAPGGPVPKPGSGGLKILGGCGIAGCLGAVLAMGAVVALMFVIAIGSSHASTGGRSALRGGGSLRDLVHASIGSYSLVSTGRVTRLGSKLSPGVVDDLAAVYEAPDGTRVVQILLAYPSQVTAEQRMSDVYLAVSTMLGPGQHIERGTIKKPDGTLVGTRVAITGTTKQHVYWSDGRLLTFVTSSPPHALAFFHAAPY